MRHLDVLSGHVGLGAVCRDADGTDAGTVGVLEVGDGPGAEQRRPPSKDGSAGARCKGGIEVGGGLDGQTARIYAGLLA